MKCCHSRLRRLSSRSGTPPLDHARTSDSDFPINRRTEVRYLALVIAAAVSATSASAIPVSAFLAKEQAVQSKGAFALFSGDYKLLMDQVKGDFARLRSERSAAVAAHRST